MLCCFFPFADAEILCKQRTYLLSHEIPFFVVVSFGYKNVPITYLKSSFNLGRQSECLVLGDNGSNYNGTVNTTIFGRTCQRWDSEVPHLQPYIELMAGENNYCRNPTNDAMPWCYTTDPDTMTEFCLIPKCEGEK